MMIQTGQFERGENQPSANAGGDTSTFEQVNFPQAFPAGSQVQVFATVQTFNGRDTPGIRVADVNEEGFKIRMNEIVIEGNATGGTRVSETIGWMAIAN